MIERLLYTIGIEEFIFIISNLTTFFRSQKEEVFSNYVTKFFAVS